MNYYNHHLGDYAAATGHLSWDEDLAYRRLLSAYYHHEKPIPADLKAACRLVRAQTSAQRAAVETVLQEFFVLHADGWRQSRCDAEIERANGKKEKAKRSAEMRWGAERTHCEGNANASPDDDANAMRTHSDGNAPNSQEPITKKKTMVAAEASTDPPTDPPTPPLRAKDLVAEGVDRQAAADWLALRKAKRLPLTVTAWADTKAEGSKAGLSPPQTVAKAVANNWAGFKAAWLDRDSPGKPGSARVPDDVFAGAV